MENNLPSVERIEPILLKHIIEHQREYLKPDLPDDTRRFNARWYLINSTPSYRGLIAGINELISEVVAQRDKEIEKWKDAFTSVNAQLKELRQEHNNWLQRESQYIDDKEKEIEGLKQENDWMKSMLAKTIKP